MQLPAWSNGFHWIGHLLVAMSVYPYIYMSVPLPCNFLKGRLTFPPPSMRFCQFRSVSVCFCPFLSVSVQFTLVHSVSVCFCPFLYVSVRFCLFLSVSVSFCRFLSIWVFVGYWCYYPHTSRDSVSPVCGKEFPNFFSGILILGCHHPPWLTSWSSL